MSVLDCYSKDSSIGSPWSSRDGRIFGGFVAVFNKPELSMCVKMNVYIEGGFFSHLSFYKPVAIGDNRKAPVLALL